MAELKVLKFDLTEVGVELSIGEALSESLGDGFMFANVTGAGNYIVYVMIRTGNLTTGIRPLTPNGPAGPGGIIIPKM